MVTKIVKKWNIKKFRYQNGSKNGKNVPKKIGSKNSKKENEKSAKKLVPKNYQKGKNFQISVHFWNMFPFWILSKFVSHHQKPLRRS